MKSRYYNRRGECISITQWAQDYQNFNETHRIAETTVGDRRVSTVLLGLDHRFGETGPPIIFETMIFGVDNFDDEGMWRYSTEEEAQAGHNQVVEALKGNGTFPE